MGKTWRTSTVEFKTRVVLELIAGHKGLLEASREYGIKATGLSRWKQEFLISCPAFRVHYTVLRLWSPSVTTA